MSDRPKLILARPCYPDFLGDRMFVASDPSSASHSDPYIRLRQRVVDRGWEIHTWDVGPLDSADILLFQDLPATRAQVEEARRSAPRAKFVLQIVESPLSRPHYFLKANHDLFDAILTYCPSLCDEIRYFRYYLPVGNVPAAPADPLFSQRRPLVMINSNRWLGIWPQRQAGWTGLPFVGPWFSGWNIPLGSLLSQNRGELYSRRRHIARLAESFDPELLDVFGAGWQGEAMSWAHRIIPHRRFAVGRGSFSGDKLDLLPRYRFAVAFENVRGRMGYISEKIFDPLFAGTVPIYLGDEDITDQVPADCFVDARRFKDDRELLEFARNCPESQWRQLRDAGRKYLESPAFQRFGPDAFADTVMKVLCRVGSPSDAASGGIAS
jgi:hypothetical protein